MIALLSFEQGTPMHVEDPVAQARSLLLGNKNKVRMLSEGNHDITPHAFDFRKFDYTLEVRSDGTGTLSMSARYPDVISIDASEGKIHRPIPGDQTCRLPDDQSVFILAGPNMQRDLQVWAIALFIDEKESVA